MSEIGISIQMPVARMEANAAVDYLRMQQIAAEANGLPFEVIIPEEYPIEHAVRLLFNLMRWGSGSSNFTVVLPETETNHPHLAKFRRIHSDVKFRGVPIQAKEKDPKEVVLE